jgi:DNA invertase Pin-like site-specific DNA recombinase
MKIGYIRVSTVLQHTERQDDRLADAGVEKIFSEKISGKDTNRPQLKAMLDFISAGDEVYVTELSRLARSTVDLYEIAKVVKEKGAKLKSLKEEIDLDSATGKLTFGMLAVLAEFERNLTKERQMEGIKAAKARGKSWGAKIQYGTNPREVHDVMFAYSRKKIALDEAMEKLNMKRSTFFYRYKKWREENELGEE